MKSSQTKRDREQQTNICDLMSFINFYMDMFSCYLFVCSIGSIMLQLKGLRACVYVNDDMCL